MKYNVWFVIVLPAVLLMALADGQLPAMADDPITTIDGTITGVFLNSATNQFETTTLPVSSSSADYCYADEEQYTMHATFTTASGTSATEDFIITSSVTYNLDGPPVTQMVWNLSIAPTQITIGGGSCAVRIITDEQGNVWIEVCGIRFPIRKVSPPGQLTVKVYLKDTEKTPSDQPLSGAKVEIYLKGKFKASRLTDANGDAKFEKVAPGEYRTRALKNQAIPACTEVNDTTTVLKDQGNSTSLYLYSHKPIKGRAMEQTGGGPLPLSGAKAALYRGDQKLSSDYTSGTDGYFAIDPLAIDGILANNGSGAYTVKVYPPVRSMMRVSPYPGVSDVALTRCQRTQSADECSRRATVDAGIFSFTYMPISQ